MKNTVTLEELNAAIILMAGIPLNAVSELHLSPGQVTVVYVDQEDGELVNRVHITRIDYPQPPAPEETPDEETDEVPEPGDPE